MSNLKAVEELPNPQRQAIIDALRSVLKETRDGEVGHTVIMTTSEDNRSFTVRSQGTASHLVELGMLAQAMHSALNSPSIVGFKEEPPPEDEDVESDEHNQRD